MKLDEKLVTLRKEKGLTQLKVAEELNISRQAISRWEVGAAVPSIENLKSLSELYEVPIDYLLSESTERPMFVGEAEKQPLETPPRKENEKINIIIVVSILIFVVVSIFIYRSVIAEKNQKYDFNEIESESWGTSETDGFKMSW